MLPSLSMFLGERRAIFIYIAVALVLQCLAWLIPILASTAVCTAIEGLVISTFYAAAITMGGKLIPRHMHADAFSIMSAVGQSGSAFWPLIVGIMSTKEGIWVVEPTVVALLVALAVCWWLVPRIEKRDEQVNVSQTCPEKKRRTEANVCTSHIESTSRDHANIRTTKM